MPLLEVGDGESVLDRAADVAHRHLALDCVFIAELSVDELVFRAVAGDAVSFGVAHGQRRSRTATLSHRLVVGDIPRFINDTHADPRIAALPGTGAVGAYVGAPLRHSDGTVYGAIFGLASKPDTTLDERDVRFLEMLSELLAGYLDGARETDLLQSEMSDLIARERLDIAAQPVISLRDGACLGLEALSRFPSGTTTPAETFAAAGRVGLDFELERLAVRRAWPLLALLGPRQFLTVNLSPGATAALSRRASRLAGLPLSQLVVEITEHSMIAGYDDLRDVLRPLRKAGLRVAIDDAGAGYASLRHVVELRPDFIKVDRELVHGLADDHARRVAVSAFVLLALDLDATVIAEGLERPADLAALYDLGVDAAQGFLLGRPTTNHDEIHSMLGSRLRMS